jgi:hypothetical protein
MLARRFLIAVTVMTLLLVAAAFAIFQFGGTVLRESFTPQGHFAPPPPQSGPDYGQAESWIARPDIANNPGEWLPTGAAPTRVQPGAAIFYVHPTTYLRGDRWNAPLNDTESGWRDQLFVRSQASALNAVGEVWAPRYRQAAYGAFLLKSDDAEQALGLAYRDVAAAFDAFLREIDPKRPIVLAGHSQGALHLMRLLEQRKGELKNRLVAAYAVGWPISIRADAPALGFPVCREADEAGCILSWMSFVEPANPSLILSSWERTPGPTGEERRREDIACVNPISGELGGVALPADNPGTLVPNGDFSSAALLPAAVGAHCDDGLLIVDGEVPPLGPYVLPGNNYHVYDFALFWGAVRRDAERRLAAWQR